MADLARISTSDLIAEVIRRGVDLSDLPWEDCATCQHFARFNDSTGLCGVRERPVWFPDGLGGDSNPESVGWYAVDCMSRSPCPDPPPHE